jgi:hypothetical protein
MVKAVFMTIANRLAVAVLAWNGFLPSLLLSSAYSEGTEVGVRRTADGYVVRYASGWLRPLAGPAIAGTNQIRLGNRHDGLTIDAKRM